VSSTPAFLRANPVVIAILAFAGIAGLVLTIAAILMKREGMSLRPIVFMIGLLAIAGGPQIAYHLAQALGIIPKRDLSWTFGKDRPHAGWLEREDALTAENGQFSKPESVFGANIDRALVTDLRRGGPDSPFGSADVAQMAVLDGGSTSIVARYRDAATAADASTRYLTMAAGLVPPPGPDGTRTITRPQGDVAKVLVAGRTLVVLTGPDEAAVNDRLASSPVVAPAPQAAFVPVGDVSPEARDYWLYRPPVLIGIIVALLMITTLYFFRVSGWAATIPAKPGVPVRPASEVRERLLAVNELDTPFRVSEQSDGRLAVTWRFADAKWVDLARAHGMRRTHRILLEIDERARTVYPTEQQSRLDWSAGASGGAVQWSTSRGITFFQIEHQGVFGLQMDERGRFVPKLSYRYTFNLQEMKAPLISAVTESGWDWRPTLLHGPPWLRWLTH